MGDVFSLLIENNGAGGFYTELSRLMVLGKVPRELADAHAAVLDAQRFALSLLKPGALCREIFAQHNAYLSERGLRRFRCHIDMAMARRFKPFGGSLADELVLLSVTYPIRG